MPKSTVRKLTPKPQLKPDEVRRLADKLAVILEHKTEHIGLLTLLFTHLQTLAENNPSDLEFAFYEIKQVLFTGTFEADAAQEQFQANAFQNRAKLLQWPSERSKS